MRATLLRVLLDAGFVMVVVTAPVLVRDVLRTAPENTVYIASSGAAGVAAGLVLAPILTRFVSPRAVLLTGFSLSVAMIFGLAVVSYLAQGLDERTFLPLRQLEETFGVRREIAATMLVLPFGGLGLSLVQVASRAVVYDLVPMNSIAQVFAAQSAIGSAASFLPTLLAAVLLDLLPVEVVLAIIGTALAVLAPAALIQAGTRENRRALRNVDREEGSR
jgi:MFS-type transporter involved in bile tolerance (Atg22 family)